MNNYSKSKHSFYYSLILPYDSASLIDFIATNGNLFKRQHFIFIHL